MAERFWWLAGVLSHGSVFISVVGVCEYLVQRERERVCLLKGSPRAWALWVSVYVTFVLYTVCYLS